MLPQVSRAGEWFLRSGIQKPDGGVARFYRTDLERYQPVSTEITGYAASAFAFLHAMTKDIGYQASAITAACSLLRSWDMALNAMPFELPPAQFTYFFDCGIVVRGLLAAGLPSCGCLVAGSMKRDFATSGGGYHPILALPGKQPQPHDRLRWSQSPGCYQLKAGMCWWDLWEATGEPHYRDLYRNLADEAIRTAPSFLPGHSDSRKVVDRLHAYLYFLEGLLPVADEARAAAAIDAGIERVAGLLRELAPEFERSDVYAQLLRLRVYASRVDADADWEAARLLEFAAASDDPRIDGGFYFGRTAGKFEPYINPVSTAFALQALALWSGDAKPQRALLI